LQTSDGRGAGSGASSGQSPNALPTGGGH